MVIGNLKVLKRVIALAFFVGALPFLNFAQASASTDTCASTGASRWLDDYKKPVGFTYGASVNIQANYLWRGLYAGGLSFQPDLNVGYGGLYFDMWWNIGATDWAFSHFLPESDFSLGFNRWGLNVFVLYIHNFDCGFFDFGNYVGRGNRLEIDAKYTVSSKLPLSILWATRVSAGDGYWNENGEIVRAWSSYLELSYTHHFPYDISLYGAVGLTPWKSCYTGYQLDWGFSNVEVRLRKDWSLSELFGMMIQGQLTINPVRLAADKSTAQWHPANPGGQSINANITLGVYLK